MMCADFSKWCYSRPSVSTISLAAGTVGSGSQIPLYPKDTKYSKAHQNKYEVKLEK